MKTQDLLGQLLANPGVAGLAGGVLGGLLGSKAGRKLGKSALQLGGAAAIAGLAYTAWRRHQADRGNTTGVESGEPTLAQLVARRYLPPPPHDDAGEDLARVLLMAMIAAARADGSLDARESERIRLRMAALDLDPRSQAALESQLTGPVDLDALVRAATTPEIALEIYTASLLAIEPDTPAERGYLALLAARLGLTDELVQALHREVADLAPSPAEPAARVTA